MRRTGAPSALLAACLALVACGRGPGVCVGAGCDDAGPSECDGGACDAGPSECDGGACDAGPGECDGGPCDAGPRCPAGQLFCEGECLDVAADDLNCGACGNTCVAPMHCGSGACTVSNVRHVVLIVQENHTFDSYFGRYCQADAGSNPACTEGSACCEGAPPADPNGQTPFLLDDALNLDADPNHSQACELEEIADGGMSGFTAGSDIGSSICASACSRHHNFALADATTVPRYWEYAQTYALADRYFQPIAGSSSSNDMYFASAHIEFVDNGLLPKSIGSGCSDPLSVCTTSSTGSLPGKTIGDLLVSASHSFAVYADGYAEAVAAGSGCASIPDECPYDLLHPVLRRGCLYDPSDIPFEYFPAFTDKPLYMRDYGAFAGDIAQGSLPDFAYVKARTFRNEHPEFSNLTDGQAFVDATVQAILGSAYADDTLILLTWDEGGGFYDHVPPPPSVDVDSAGKPVSHGTRVPFLALGRFARKNAVSHVVMDHASVVRFLEYNFVGPTGGLGAADAKVNGLGSLLDPSQTGIAIP